MTPLTSFMIDNDSGVVQFTEASTLRGLRTGSAVVRLQSRPATFASVVVEVSEDGVNATRFVPRLVTGMAWDDSPPLTLPAPPVSDFIARARVVQSLTKEGASGRVHASVEWDDGTHESVGYGTDIRSGRMNVTALPGSYLVPGVGQDGFWMLQVANGASAQCGDLAFAQ